MAFKNNEHHLDGRSELEKNEVSTLRDEAPVEGLTPVGSCDAVVLIVFDIRISLGSRVFVWSEQSHFTKLLVFQFLLK